MAAWAGFSDDDLKKIKKTTPSDGPNRLKNASFQPASHTKQSNMHRDRQTMPKRPSGNNSINKNQSLVGENSKTSHSLSQVSRKEPSEVTAVAEPTISAHEAKSQTDMPVKVEATDPAELNDTEALSRDMKTLEKFREQQKAIEEANKQKKELLSKTLSERRRKAKLESHKLEHIQRELAKLDHLLTADVQVIRNRIESTSRDFLEAQKRYERAEKEFIEAKMDLHEQAELKEQMTEHLYTIIHKNEMRKARKLAELMKELEMDNTEEEFQLPELPPLSSFQPTNSVFLSPTRILPPVTQPPSVLQPTPVTQPPSSTQPPSVLQPTLVTQPPSGLKPSSVSNHTEDPTVNSETSSGSEKSEGDVLSKPDAPQTDGATVKESVQTTNSISAAEGDAQNHDNTDSSSVNNSEPSQSNIDSTSTKVIQGQTLKIVGDLQAHVQKELETVERLIDENSVDLSIVKKEPNSWSFVESSIIKQDT